MEPCFYVYNITLYNYTIKNIWILYGWAYGKDGKNHNSQYGYYSQKSLCVSDHNQTTRQNEPMHT